MKPRSILVPIAMMIFATACFSQAIAANKAVAAPILGVWRSQMEGLPAVTLTVTDEGGSLGDPPVSFQLKLDPDGKTASSSGNEHDPNAPIYVFTRTDY